MAFLSRDQFRTYGARATATQKFAARQKFGTKTAGVRATVFLSHSHEDAELIEPFLLMLGEEGVLVYVDWKDPTMPPMTNPETAVRLKERIKLCRKFMILATNKALESRWVPWELGIADAQNGISHVAVIPVEDSGSTWKGSEYIGIYGRVEPASNGKLAVFEPGKHQGIYLSEWLVQ